MVTQRILAKSAHVSAVDQSKIYVTEPAFLHYYGSKGEENVSATCVKVMVKGQRQK